MNLQIHSSGAKIPTERQHLSSPIFAPNQAANHVAPTTNRDGFMSQRYETADQSSNIQIEDEGIDTVAYIQGIENTLKRDNVHTDDETPQRQVNAGTQINVGNSLQSSNIQIEDEGIDTVAYIQGIENTLKRDNVHTDDETPQRQVNAGTQINVGNSLQSPNTYFQSNIQSSGGHGGNSVQSSLMQNQNYTHMQSAKYSNRQVGNQDMQDQVQARDLQGRKNQLE